MMLWMFAYHNAALSISIIGVFVCQTEAIAHAFELLSLGLIYSIIVISKSVGFVSCDYGVIPLGKEISLVLG